MLKKERKYEFRDRLRVLHRSNLRDYRVVAKEEELEIATGWSINLPADYTEVSYTAAKDFQDYLFTSMKVSVLITNQAERAASKVIELLVDASQKEDYVIRIEDNVVITGRNERGLAQALYCLEDKMNVKKAPILAKDEIRHTFLFSPRMVHSGYGLDQYPNEHLAAIAHSGMDAILVFVKGVNTTPSGFFDFNELIGRAAKYGIDVYAYSYLKSEMHPEEEGAQEFYDKLYGTLFKECPGLKGITLVGESVGFPSHDPHVTPANTAASADGIPYGKPKPGWWPCYDYPQWLECVKKAVRKYKEDADIVFWTYNWGYVAEEERVKLIKSLPTDITLQATYEMFDSWELEGCMQTCADYSLAYPGPGNYFVTEAKAAAERGIRLYAMANTGGLTWDMGTIPYQPMPYQWMERYKGLREANAKYGLCGLMDAHHYGFWPSFISDLAKQCFIAENTDMEACLKDVVRARFVSAAEENTGDHAKAAAQDNAKGVTQNHAKDTVRDNVKDVVQDNAQNIAQMTDKICQALKLWSEAIRYYTPGDADQYGAFRVGPSYPFCLIKEIKPPSEKHAHFGTRILEVSYPADYNPTSNLPCGRGMLPSLRVKGELSALGKMLDCMERGVEILKQIADPNEELSYLLNLGEYMCTYIITGIHAKEWYVAVSRLRAEQDRDKVLELLQEIKRLIHAERANAERAIPLVEKDSRLGWEPGMDYVGDAEHIRWKLRHLDYVEQFEVKCYENGSDSKWYAGLQPES